MKTHPFYLAKFGFAIIIFAFYSSIGFAKNSELTTNFSFPEPSNVELENDEVMEIEEWMTNDACWATTSEFASKILQEPVVEDDLPIENWMNNDEFWKCQDSKVSKNFPIDQEDVKLEIVSWMTDEELWRF